VFPLSFFQVMGKRRHPHLFEQCSQTIEAKLASLSQAPVPRKGQSPAGRQMRIPGATVLRAIQGAKEISGSFDITGINRWAGWNAVTQKAKLVTQNMRPMAFRVTNATYFPKKTCAIR
jgi:hypothetical protein